MEDESLAMGLRQLPIALLVLALSGCNGSAPSTLDLESEISRACSKVKMGWLYKSNSESGRQNYLEAAEIFRKISAESGGDATFDQFVDGLLRASRQDITLDLYDVATYCGVDIDP